MAMAQVTQRESEAPPRRDTLWFRARLPAWDNPQRQAATQLNTQTDILTRGFKRTVNSGIQTLNGGIYNEQT